jgi:hypothetical protein
MVDDYAAILLDENAQLWFMLANQWIFFPDS